MLLAYKISIVFALLAVIAYARGYIVYGRFKWIAVLQPIDITTPGNYESGFVAQMSSNHAVILGTEQKLDLSEQGCRLGIETPDASECENFPQKYLISWTVLRDGEPVASGRSDETTSGSWGTEIEKTLGHFEATKGDKYKLEIQVIEPDPSLAVTNPKIKIHIGKMEYKSALVRASLAYRAGMILAGVAALIAVVTFAMST